MEYESLIVKREGAVDYVTLNRPDVRNAFNDRMIADLYAWAQTARAAAEAGELRVAVIAGAGPAFCAGADVAWMRKASQLNEADNVQDGLAAARVFAALNDLPIGVIGASFGPVATGSLSDHFTRQAAAAAGVVGTTPQALEPFRAAGLHAAMYVIPILAGLLTLVLFAGSRTVPWDAAALQRWMREEGSV